MIRKWTRESIAEEAVKYSNKTDFKLYAAGAYKAARKFGLLDTLYPIKKKYQRPKWSSESDILREAAKYKSKTEFRINASGAFFAARAKGMLDDIFGKHSKWTIESLRELSRRHTRTEFIQNFRGAYKAAIRFGVLDELYVNDNVRWDKDKLIVEASKYSSRNEFCVNAKGAYKAANKLNMLPELYDKLTVDWDLEKVELAAKECSSKSEFSKRFGRAYAISLKYGIIDELFTTSKTYTEANVIYVWRAIDITYNGNQVYKFGISSLSNYRDRISTTITNSKFNGEVLFCRYSLNARNIERELLRIGDNPKYSRFSGSTEFRAVDVDSFKEVENLINMYSSADNDLNLTRSIICSENY